MACAYTSNACDATTLLVHAKSLISAGHALLDDDGALHATDSAALEAVRAFTMLCHPYMDVTGGREWDCSRWLTALLSSEIGRAAVGLNAPPTTVLELGASTRHQAAPPTPRQDATPPLVTGAHRQHSDGPSSLWWPLLQVPTAEAGFLLGLLTSGSLVLLGLSSVDLS